MTRYDANPVEEIGVIPLPSGFQPRGETPPLPTPLDNWLNKAQMLSLRTMEYFGWELWFVRRQQAPTVVVIRDSYSAQFAVLEPGGQINQEPMIKLRVEI